jgi:hypothetical protein
MVEFFIPYRRKVPLIVEPDNLLSRSLRSWTYGQYIVTIVWSEILDIPLEQEFIVKVYTEKLSEAIERKGRETFHWGVTR